MTGYGREGRVWQSIGYITVNGRVGYGRVDYGRIGYCMVG